MSRDAAIFGAVMFPDLSCPPRVQIIFSDFSWIDGKPTFVIHVSVRAHPLKGPTVFEPARTSVGDVWHLRDEEGL